MRSPNIKLCPGLRVDLAFDMRASTDLEAGDFEYSVSVRLQLRLVTLSSMTRNSAGAVSKYQDILGPTARCSVGEKVIC